MPVFLKGLSLQFYRGIGAAIQPMFPFKEFNFFIGANNAGKSTVLNFISDYLPFAQLQNGKARTPGSLEQHRGIKSGNLSVSLGLASEDFKTAVINSLPAGRRFGNVEQYVGTVVDIFAQNGVMWLKVGDTNQQKFTFMREVPIEKLQAIMPQNAWYQLWQGWTGQNNGGLTQHWIPETIKAFLNAQNVSLPQVKMIPALRQVGKAGAAFSDYSGEGLIDRLAQIQSPDHDKREERALFEKINAFLQEVTSKPDAQIEIPHNREHILVHMDNKVLPLSSLGMGIHEVIMIASFCTLTSDQIVCIEEPEIHLHPLLQRKLIAYLRDKTRNQYFVATHSASFIDMPGAAIFHVSNNGEQTQIKETVLRSDRHNICTDLGYKASDIVQSNAVIWVEGPSDRIYIRHWLRAMNPELIEGIHYSIMFYGGRLLSHLSVDAEELGEFIALRSLNQHLALVMDSDKKSSHAVINDTKKRLVEEFSKGEGVCWLTRGREIENYIDYEILQGAVKSIYKTIYDTPAGGGAYDHALHFKRLAPKRRRKKELYDDKADLIETDIDKIGVARLVCESVAKLDTLDLSDKMDELVKMIERANT